MKPLCVSQSAMKLADESTTQSKDKPTTKPTLEDVCTGFESRRRRKRRGSRIPKCFWAAAAEVCVDQPLFQVSRALGLNYTELKRRVAGTRSAPDTQQSRQRGFVELSLSGVEAQPILYSIEIESPKGSKLKMSFAGNCRDLDAVELAKVFWSAVQ